VPSPGVTLGVSPCRLSEPHKAGHMGSTPW
jgi:hypothetical protein